MPTRSQVAEFLADRLQQDRAGTVRSVAAWLVSTQRSRQAGYVAREAAHQLAERGYLMVVVTTARPLSPAAEQTVKDWILATTGARHLEVQMRVSPEVVGGVRIQTPTAELDATVQAKLARIVEGVQL